MRERRAAWGRATHGRSRVPELRSPGRTPSPPECAAGRGALRDARGKTWLRSPGRLATARLPQAPGRVGGGPTCPHSPPLAVEESGGCGTRSSPPPRPVARRRNPLPRPDPRGRTAAREGGRARGQAEESSTCHFGRL